jgi:hypothetical protein
MKDTRREQHPVRMRLSKPHWEWAPSSSSKAARALCDIIVAKKKPRRAGYGFFGLVVGDRVVGRGVFGATVLLPKTPKPIRRSRTIRQAAEMPNVKTDLARETSSSVISL